ncbi:MAG: hemolysin III family protein [Clostridia bacterium]|nr:hemolysin III family protein [Clostridia bacterium]
MKITRDVALIEYSHRVDFLNHTTHAAAAVLALFGAFALIGKAAPLGKTALFSCVVYSITLLCVYTVSAVYHALPQGEKRRRARLFDHLAIPLLLAGTTTPCALVTLYRISHVHALIVFGTAWFCAVFGIIAKLLFFEKLKALVIVVYFTGGAGMLASAFAVTAKLNHTGLALLVTGSVFYIIGALFCKAGIKRPALHVVFHIFTALGSLLHFLSIYLYVI